jgi:hypothetical protein
MIMMFWYGHNMGWWGYAGMHVGIAPFPLVHLALESVAQCLGTSLPVAKGKHWGTTKPRLLHRVLDDGFAVGFTVHRDDDPVDVPTRFLVLRTDDRDRAMRLFGEFGGGRTQDRSGVAPYPDRADADHVGVAGFRDEGSAGRPIQNRGFDLDRLSSGLNRGLRRPQ